MKFTQKTCSNFSSNTLIMSVFKSRHSKPSNKKYHFNAKCKIGARLNKCARDKCTGRCDVTNTDRSPRTLPRSQKPLRIMVFSHSHLGAPGHVAPHVPYLTAVSDRGDNTPRNPRHT